MKERLQKVTSEIFWSVKFNKDLEGTAGQNLSLGIGTKFFRNKTAPSFYLAGIYGFTKFTRYRNWGHGTEESNDPSFSIAFGYELANRWELEMSHIRSIPESNYDAKIRSLQVNLIYGLH